MPTNETPSAGAVARHIYVLWQKDPNTWPEDEITTILDIFAREREAAVWEEAASRCDEAASQPYVLLDACKELARQFRARAAEARRTP